MALRYLGDQVRVSEFAGVAHRVAQHDFFELVPDRIAFQNRQERTDTRAGCDHPQVRAFGDFADGQETGGPIRHQHIVAGAEREQARR